MASSNGTRYLHICLACGHERWTTHKHNPSGLCGTCALRAGRELQLTLHYAPGALYADETLAKFWAKVDKDHACPCHSWEDRCWLWIGTITKSTGYGRIIVDGKVIGTHRFAYQATHGLLPKGISVLHRPPCLLRHCVRHLYAGTPQQNTDDAKAMLRFPTGTKHAEMHHEYQAVPRGEAHWTQAYAERLPHGEAHWTHKHPERIARGDTHWTHRHPERVAYGEEHAKRHQQYVGLPRSDGHWTHMQPDRVHRGSGHGNAKLTEEQIREIRQYYPVIKGKHGLVKAFAQRLGVKRPTIIAIANGRRWKHVQDETD